MTRRSMKAASLAAALVLCAACDNKKSDSGSGPAAPPASASAAASATAATAASAPPANEITFVKKDLAVGGGWEETLTLEDRLLATKPQKAENNLDKKTSLRTEILAVDGNKITKVKVIYGDKTSVETWAGKQRDPFKDPVSGRTYVAELKNDKVVVTAGDGKPMGTLDDVRVKSDVSAWFGKPDPVLAGIPGGAMKPGDAAKSLTEIVRDLLKDGEDVEVTEGSAKLQSVATVGAYRIGIFEVKVKATRKSAMMKTTWDLSGTMTVRADTTRLTNVQLSGPVATTGIVENTGTTKITIDYK